MRYRFAIHLLVLCATAGTADAATVGEVYKTVKESVVVIEVTQKDVDPTVDIGLVSLGSLGSGVLISDDGKIMTAAHVVQIADTIQVRFHSGEEIKARVLSSEPAADLALLQLERLPRKAQIARVGDSDLVEVGDPVFVVGAPLGMDYTLTVGHISAHRREGLEVGGTLGVDQFQTDAAINQGNSGGPMFNMKGEVIGIVSYIMSQGGGFEGLGFVITSNLARELLLEHRSIWSGLRGQIVTGELARILNVPQSTGLLVERVADQSLATHLGVRGGDIKLQIADVALVLGGDIILDALGVSLAEPGFDERIRSRARTLEDGDEVVLRVLRGGQIVELKNYFFPDLLVPPTPAKAAAAG